MRMRRANAAEFTGIRKFYWDLIDQMQGRQDTVGWKKGIYPADSFLQESLDRGELYVIDGADGPLACVILNSLWNEGYEGLPWRCRCAREEVLVPHALAVAPAEQGKGLGRQLVRELIGLAEAAGKKAVRLDILSGNLAAERLYTGMGFQYVATKALFYEDTGLTAFRMYELALPVAGGAQP